MKSLIFFILLLFGTILIHAQRGAFYPLTSVRFAKAAGLGNVFTGITEGAETACYNSAGAAFEDDFSMVYPFSSPENET